MTVELTKAERALLDLLVANAREPVASLARKLGISRTTILDRIRKLERIGAIAGYTVIKGPLEPATQVTAHTLLRLLPKRVDSVVAALKKKPEVTAVYALSGDFDLLAILRADRMEDIDATIDSLGELDGVERTQTSMVLAVKFERP